LPKDGPNQSDQSEACPEEGDVIYEQMCMCAIHKMFLPITDFLSGGENPGEDDFIKTLFLELSIAVSKGQAALAEDIL